MFHLFIIYQKPSPTSLANDNGSPDGLGALAPLGFWDPLGLADDTDGFTRRRAVEIKHGRICMIAFLGMAVQELGWSVGGNLDLAGNYPFSDVLKDGMGFAALGNVPALGNLLCSNTFIFHISILSH